jgi:DNA sulfur modification protein DndC
LESILQRDWEDLEAINERNQSFRKRGKSHVEEVKDEFAEFFN